MKRLSKEEKFWTKRGYSLYMKVGERFVVLLGSRIQYARSGCSIWLDRTEGPVELMYFDSIKEAKRKCPNTPIRTAENNSSLASEYAALLYCSSDGKFKWSSPSFIKDIGLEQLAKEMDLKITTWHDFWENTHK